MSATSATRAPTSRPSPTTTRPLPAPPLSQPTAPVPLSPPGAPSQPSATSKSLTEPPAPTYNAIQTKFEKRTGNGLFLLNSFTYSRTFDLAGGHLETSNGDNSRVNFANPNGDYGRSNYDQPLNNTTSIIYDLPYGKGRHFGANSNYALQALAGGWQITVINTATSGLPANLNYTNSTSNGTNVTDLYTYRPNVVGSAIAPAANRVKTNTALTGYLLKASASGQPGVSVPITGSPFGNAQRNSVVSPAFFQTDLGLHKAIPSLPRRPGLRLPRRSLQRPQ